MRQYLLEQKTTENQELGKYTIQTITVLLSLTQMVTTSKPFVIERKMHNKPFNRIVKPLRALSTG